MSNETNLEVVQKLYTAFGAGDMPGILSSLSEDIDWIFNARPEDVPFGGHHQGHEGMIKFFSTVGQTVEILEFGPTEINQMGDKVLVLGHEQVRVRATGKVFQSDWAHFFTVKNGKVVRLREFYDTASLAAAFREN